MRRFDTLAALAAHYEIDPGILAKTVEDFNGYVTAKLDPDFGKLILKDARPLSTPPFYAARVWPKVHHTMGGVENERQGEVIDLDGAVIPGLFAAGEITGGVHGACRLEASQSSTVWSSDGSPAGLCSGLSGSCGRGLIETLGSWESRLRRGSIRSRTSIWR